MNETGLYHFPDQQRAILESLPVALAVYQFLNNKVITLLVSDGLCDMMGMNRQALISFFDQSMFASVHPDDVQMLADLGYRFATHGGTYDIVYRARHQNRDGYQLIHTIGKYRQMEDGTQIAFLNYHNITEAQQHTSDIVKEFELPKLQFFNDNTGALAIVSRTDHRLFYYNKAMTRILNPSVAFDSGMTFQQFFFSDYPEGIHGLFDIVDVGPRVVENPITRQPLEVSVISTVWNDQLAYVLYFYEHASDNHSVERDNALRHQRMIFNAAVMSGSSNGLPYYQNGYRGFHVWNLTKNQCVVTDGWRAFHPEYSEGIEFDVYIQLVNRLAVEREDHCFLLGCLRESMLQAFENGSYPRQYNLSLQTSKGRIAMYIETVMMRAPDSGDVYLKITEENITRSSIIQTLLQKTVEQNCEYLVYADVLSDTCIVLYGNSAHKDMRETFFHISDLVRVPADLLRIRHIFGVTFQSLDDILQYFEQQADEHGEFTTLYEMPDGGIKSLRVWMIDREHQIFSMHCTDVTTLLQTERSREKELENAKNEALSINNHLQQAVLAERHKVEQINMQTMLSISHALDARDESTSQHSQRVAIYAAEIARRLHWVDERTQNIRNIALVHDIGKIGIPDALLKKNGCLTAEEYELIKQHVVIGHNILKDFTAIDMVAESALYHHERYDGRGYPQGLRGEGIPIECRIIGIADAVDAMNSARHYRQRQSEAYIISELTRERACQFDPNLVDIMLDMIKDGILNDTPAATVPVG